MNLRTGRRARAPSALFLLALAGLVCFVLALTRRRCSKTHSCTGSTVVATACGLMEVAIEGAGRPILVVHGTPGGYDQGLAAGRLLDLATFRIIAPSRPGYLRTPLETGRTPAAQADAVAALLDCLALPQVAVVALSAGGPLALELALRHPQRVSRLVLWQAVTQRVAPADLDMTPGGPVPDFSVWLVRVLLGQLPGLLLGPGLHHPRLAARVWPVAAGALPLTHRLRGVINDIRQLAKLPDYPLCEISVPTLVVHGTDDSAVPVKHALHAAASIPGAKLVTAAGGDHATTPITPTVVAAICSFLAAT